MSEVYPTLNKDKEGFYRLLHWRNNLPTPVNEMQKHIMRDIIDYISMTESFFGS
jgi:hypothetical protein